MIPSDKQWVPNPAKGGRIGQIALYKLGHCHAGVQGHSRGIDAMCHALSPHHLDAQQSPGLFGTFTVLSPPIADFVRDAGYDTVEKLTDFVTDAGAAKPAPKGGPGFFGMGNNFHVAVTGASNNNYWMIGGMVPAASVRIDDWR